MEKCEREIEIAAEHNFCRGVNLRRCRTYKVIKVFVSASARPLRACRRVRDASRTQTKGSARCGGTRIRVLPRIASDTRGGRTRASQHNGRRQLLPLPPFYHHQRPPPIYQTRHPPFVARNGAATTRLRKSCDWLCRTCNVAIERTIAACETLQGGHLVERAPRGGDMLPLVAALRVSGSSLKSLDVQSQSYWVRLLAALSSVLVHCRR